ncbi:uncharacterized protein N7503_002174 [Penicillium pulvis]|uniref:uncharacterized protein n=1 Tax=Penicillium pulvis TaxID=1562058 RepID=UPI002546904D|nr:uncharacterized protein N7503_002174 [Penicillium pulvis]KAJ5809956.1 hypothetical protein N7503_002174 [Penicillium pulvis]
MATPSAKPGATPTHLTSSPHPSSAPLSRSIAHKSPSTRTPTASGPGHTHQVSVSSSHQYATPLAVSNAVDDSVNFTSPSALLALGGYTGISPSPAVHDALGGHGLHDNDIQNLGMQGLKLGVGRDNDEEQRHRIEEVVLCLHARVAGRGVSREGVERLSRLEGFESIWQDNDINIAGNFVDLEIEFHAGHDVVKDVSLRYATPEFTEGERREEATAVLKRNLAQSPQDSETGNWKSLQGFYENLQWLAKLDKLSQEVNCFEALEGLEENLKRIWVEEGKNSKYGGDYEHLCSGIIGRPSMHKGSRIGLGLEFWVDQAKVLDVKAKRSPDAMVIDGEAIDLEDQERIWTVMIECEEGYPSLRISKEWIGTEVFTSGDKSESSPPAETVRSVEWLDPPQTMRLSHGNHPDPMALDSSMLESSPPNRRFVAKLEPPLDIPILAASDIYRHLGMQLPHEFKMFTYDWLLVSDSTASDASPQPSRRKRRMSVYSVDSTGTTQVKQHNYTFQAFESVAGRKIRELPFSHPRQIADILPVLRQYALLASLIRKVFKTPTQETPDKTVSAKTPSTKSTPTKLSSALSSGPDPSLFNGSENTITLSNDDPNEEKLNMLLSDGFPTAENSGIFSWSNDQDDRLFMNDVKVDVTLRSQLGQSPALMLLITNPGKNIGSVDKFVRESVQVSLCFEVGLNGCISVVDSSGLNATNGDAGDTEMQGTDDKPSLQNIHKKIARVLETSQDLGILVEWVLRERLGSG